MVDGSISLAWKGMAVSVGSLTWYGNTLRDKGPDKWNDSTFRQLSKEKKRDQEHISNHNNRAILNLCGRVVSPLAQKMASLDACLFERAGTVIAKFQRFLQPSQRPVKADTNVVNSPKP